MFNKITGGAQTSTTGAQFLDFQNLPLALILLSPCLFHIFADSDPDHSQLIFMDPDSDPDHSQNLITCSLSHLGHILYNFIKIRP